MNTMVVDGTPIERYEELGLWVKREDTCCPGGPNFSKTRGVYAHVLKRPEHFIGVLDTSHSQGGWAVARACQLLGKQCVLFYPERKGERGAPLKPQQQAARDLGAQLLPIQAGRSAVLYHSAKKWLENGDYKDAGGHYMMPNALKLPEMITETAAEVARTARHILAGPSTILISASSGTIAAGVLLGLRVLPRPFRVVVHMGYSRPVNAMRSYMLKMIEPYGGGVSDFVGVEFIDEGYAYADEARPGIDPPFPCNKFYDLKLLRFWSKVGRERWGEALLWNIG